ncbi:MAG: hypothetical protein ABI794_14165 [Betaproteobacteria bacterium]
MSLDPREVAMLADSVDAAAFAHVFEAVPAALRSQIGLRIEPVADATLLVAPGMPATILNRAIGLGLRQAATEESVAVIAATDRASGAKAWWLHWNPWAAPEGLDCEFQQPAKGLSCEKIQRPLIVRLAVARDEVP